MSPSEMEKFMAEALHEAEKAFAEDEIPVGCVITDSEGKILGRGHNRCVQSGNPLRHAEMEAIAEATAGLGDWRLDGCTMFVTLEPCPMCAGAIMNTRVKCLVYGAKEPHTGSCASVINLFEERYPSHPAIFAGVMEEESAQIMKRFFEKKR